MRWWLLRHQLRVFVHRIRFPGKPMFSDAAAKELIGRRLMVNVTHKAHDGRLIRQEQCDGRIVRASQVEGIVIQLPSGEHFKLPPDLRWYFGARRGRYQARSSGRVVTDPDLWTDWGYVHRRDDQ